MIHTHPIFPLDTSWLGNHSLSYPVLTILILKLIDCPGGKHINNNSRTSGKDGPLTTFMNYNIVNGGTFHPPTYNLEILWSWGKTTRLHSTGLQRSSLMSTQAQTAGYEWSQSRPPKGHLNAPLQKFAPFRMLKMSYSFITIWGVPACSCRGQICWILPLCWIDIFLWFVLFDLLLCLNFIGII